MPRKRLLLKLKCHGIDGSLLHWFGTRCCSRHLLILVLCNVGGSPRYDPGPNFITFTVRMFADDPKIYRELSNIARDSEALQFDVDQLVSWASKCQLRFNFDKCEVLRITHQRDLSLPTYTLGTSLKIVKCVKDMSIMVSSDLSWSEHVNVTVDKANKLLGLVHKTAGS